MPLFAAARKFPSSRTLLAGAAVLAGLALVNRAVARQAERQHPPRGRFIEVDGVRLHYTDRGSGPPVVLLHGNVVTGEDFDTSGVAELLLTDHRVIVFDRPGFGHSDRPRGRLWTASEQADLIHKALQQLGIARPVMAGHSWGAIVALAYAVRHPADTAGLVLLSGYYFWTLRPDVLLVAWGALPVIGDILRYTVSPLLGWLMMPLVKRAMFSPAPVPARFRAEYSDAMALRPWQIRATSDDGALMIPSVLPLRPWLSGLSMPVVIMAGEGDRVVFKRRAERLHAIVPGSVLWIVKGVGHMVHHAVPRQVAEAIRLVAGKTAAPAAVPAPPAQVAAATSSQAA